MCRTFWKTDDGIADLILKAGSIIAILVAAHQYYYKLYPVWSKEKELSLATTQLEQIVKKTKNLEKKNQFLKTQKTDLTEKVANLTLKEGRLVEQFENEVLVLKELAEKEREELISNK